MANEVSPTTQNFFEKYGKAATLSSIIGRLLRFNKFGEYRAGQDDEEIPCGTKMVAYMNSLCVGYQCWKDGRPAGMAMGPIAEGFVPPKRETLGDLDKSQWETFDDGREKDPWQFTNTIVLALLEDTSELFTFSVSSKGGLNAIAQLALKYGERLRQKPDEAPVFELQVGSYQHPNRSYGEIRFPILKIIDWIPTKDLPPLDGGEQLDLLPGDGKGGAGGAHARTGF